VGFFVHIFNPFMLLAQNYLHFQTFFKTGYLHTSFMTRRAPSCLCESLVSIVVCSPNSLDATDRSWHIGGKKLQTSPVELVGVVGQTVRTLHMFWNVSWSDKHAVTWPPSTVKDRHRRMWLIGTQPMPKNRYLFLKLMDFDAKKKLSLD
jgi:hypothetical protein